MTRGWNITWRDTILRAHVSISKLVLNICHLAIFSTIWHNLSPLWTKLLAYMQSILDYWTSVRFLITDHGI